MKTLAEQIDQLKEEQLVHQELIKMLINDVGLDYAVAVEVAYHLELQFGVTKK
jgi:hypothetical protein